MYTRLENSNRYSTADSHPPAARCMSSRPPKTTSRCSQSPDWLSSLSARSTSPPAPVYSQFPPERSPDMLRGTAPPGKSPETVRSHQCRSIRDSHVLQRSRELATCSVRAAVAFSANKKSPSAFLGPAELLPESVLPLPEKVLRD